MNTFELGPLQKEWIKSLRKHPERQGQAKLGEGTPDNYTACCLGELLICANRVLPQSFPNPFSDGIVQDYGSESLPARSYKTLGLFSSGGEIRNGPLKGYTTLDLANDSGVTWPEIADFVEANPEKVFTKSI